MASVRGLRCSLVPQLEPAVPWKGPAEGTAVLPTWWRLPRTCNLSHCKSADPTVTPTTSTQTHGGADYSTTQMRQAVAVAAAKPQPKTPPTNTSHSRRHADILVMSSLVSKHLALVHCEPQGLNLSSKVYLNLRDPVASATHPKSIQQTICEQACQWCPLSRRPSHSLSTLYVACVYTTYAGRLKAHMRCWRHAYADNMGKAQTTPTSTDQSTGNTHANTRALTSRTQIMPVCRRLRQAIPNCRKVTANA
jgi:hypothetical protein